MIIEYEKSWQAKLLAIGHKMHLESRYNKFKFDEAKIIKLLDSKQACVLLKIQDNKIIGFFLGIVAPQWFGSDLSGYDLGLYIDKEYRGGTTAMRFMKKFEEYCKKAGAKDIVLGSSAEISTDIARRLYTGLGYKECGFLAHKEI